MYRVGDIVYIEQIDHHGVIIGWDLPGNVNTYNHNQFGNRHFLCYTQD